jgi:hypothetical protein
MSIQNKSFHPRLIITEHFDSIINKIDIKTETLLQDQSLTQERIDELNRARQLQIDKVKEIEKLNLTQKDFDLNSFEQQWSLLIEDLSLDFDTKINQIKEELISIDCVLLEQAKTINGLNLWITARFYNKSNLEFLE